MTDKNTAPGSTLEQQRATFALKFIRELQGKNPASYGHYVSYVSALPATIVMNGLGQALTMLVAKAKGKREEPHYLVYSHLAGWLSRLIPELRVPSEDQTQLIDRLMESNQDIYVQAQVEAMAYLDWLKQFARAYLNDTEDRDD